MKTEEKVTLKQFLIEKGAWDLFLRNLENETYEDLHNRSFDDEMLEDGVHIPAPKEGSMEFWRNLNREWKNYMNNELFADPFAIEERYKIDEDAEEMKK